MAKAKTDKVTKVFRERRRFRVTLDGNDEEGSRYFYIDGLFASASRVDDEHIVLARYPQISLLSDIDITSDHGEISVEEMIPAQLPAQPYSLEFFNQLKEPITVLVTIPREKPFEANVMLMGTYKKDPPTDCVWITPKAKALAQKGRSRHEAIHWTHLHPILD